MKTTRRNFLFRSTALAAVGITASIVTDGFTPYEDGQVFHFKSANVNTGPPTLVLTTDQRDMISSSVPGWLDTVNTHISGPIPRS